MTTDRLADLVAKLQTQLAALGDGSDASSDNEVAAYRTAYDLTQRTITGLMNAPNDLAKPERLLADAEERRAAVLQKQASLERELVDAPDWRSFRDGRERDKEYDRQQSLRQQLQMLHAGTLLRAPGMTYERLGDLDQRIAELTERRDRAQRALDGFIKQAEALLGQPV